jgi:hypothetical protein
MDWAAEGDAAEGAAAEGAATTDSGPAHESGPSFPAAADS